MFGRERNKSSAEKLLISLNTEEKVTRAPVSTLQDRARRHLTQWDQKKGKNTLKVLLTAKVDALAPAGSPH